MFDADVAARLGYYVYRLVDPRDGRTFYVGKGLGNRVFSHASGHWQPLAGEVMPAKLERIAAIQAAGLAVEHHIHRHGLDEATALHVEAALIDAYAGFANIVRGHGADRLGTAATHELVSRYQAVPAEWHHPLLLVGISRTAASRSTYDAARYAWPVSRRTLARIAYVLAVKDRLIVDAFLPVQWLPATLANFLDADRPLAERLGFVGTAVPDDIRTSYCGKRLPEGCNLSQAGIRYVGPAIA